MSWYWEHEGVRIELDVEEVGWGYIEARLPYRYLILPSLYLVHLPPWGAGP